MARVDLTEPYAIRTARKQVRESLMAHGEEVVGLRMYHAGTRDEIKADGSPRERCPNCFDSIYRQSGEYQCTVCFGTTFNGGIKQLGRMWAMFDDSQNQEKMQKRGIYQPEGRAVQLEDSPLFIENDYVVRVKRWDRDHRPVEFGDIYSLDAVTVVSLRTGNQYVQQDADRIGQRANTKALPREHVIYGVFKDRLTTRFTVPRLDHLKR